MKKAILNLRIDQSTKNALEDKCLEMGIPASQGAREAINLYVENPNSMKSHHVDDNDSIEEGSFDESYYNEDFTLVKSWLFTRFIYWLMVKWHDPFIRIDHNLCKQFMNLLVEINNNSYFTDEIKSEFSKVYNELYEYLYGNTHNRYHFVFPQQGGFDYSQLFLFMQNMDCTEDGMIIVYID